MSIRLCADLGKSATETLARIRQAIWEESINCTLVFEWKTEKGEACEEQSQQNAHHFL
jgi:hypothetical protein